MAIFFCINECASVCAYHRHMCNWCASCPRFSLVALCVLLLLPPRACTRLVVLSPCRCPSFRTRLFVLSPCRFRLFILAPCPCRFRLCVTRRFRLLGPVANSSERTTNLLRIRDKVGSRLNKQVVFVCVFVCVWVCVCVTCGHCSTDPLPCFVVSVGDACIWVQWAIGIPVSPQENVGCISFLPCRHLISRLWTSTPISMTNTQKILDIPFECNPWWLPAK
jgi:hypothetical protein